MTVIRPPCAKACFPRSSRLTDWSIGVVDHPDRDGMQDLDLLSLDVLGRDPIDLVVGRIARGGRVHRGAVVDREAGEDRLADGLVLLVQLASEQGLLADDLRGRWRWRRRVGDGGRGFGGRRRRLDAAERIGRDAVEGVGVAGLAGECGRGRRRRRLPDRVRAAVVGDVDVVAGDARAGAVGARPAYREGRLRVAGSGATLLVGGPASMVLATVGVAIEALVSKTTDACWLMAVPVARPGLGWTVYSTWPSPMPLRSSGGRKPSVTPVGAWPVIGSSDVNVAVNRPVWTLKFRSTSTFNERAVDVAVGYRGLVLRQSRGDGHIDRPEAERAELERGPIQVGAERLVDGDILRRHAAVVFELDIVGQSPGRDEEPLRAISRGTDELVGVVGARGGCGPAVAGGAGRTDGGSIGYLEGKGLGRTSARNGPP